MAYLICKQIAYKTISKSKQEQTEPGDSSAAGTLGMVCLLSCGKTLTSRRKIEVFIRNAFNPTLST